MNERELYEMLKKVQEPKGYFFNKDPSEGGPARGTGAFLPDPYRAQRGPGLFPARSPLASFVPQRRGAGKGGPRHGLRQKYGSALAAAGIGGPPDLGSRPRLYCPAQSGSIRRVRYLAAAHGG